MAWANMAVADWVRIWCLVKLVISEAISASRIRLSAALRFSMETPRLLMVCSIRFWKAPRSFRREVTSFVKSSMYCRTKARSVPPAPIDVPERSLLSNLSIVTFRASPAAGQFEPEEVPVPVPSPILIRSYR